MDQAASGNQEVPGRKRECGAHPDRHRITACCLVAIVQKMLESKRTTYELLQILSVSLMDKTPLNELFEKTENNEPVLDPTPFLPGFDF